MWGLGMKWLGSPRGTRWAGIRGIELSREVEAVSPCSLTWNKYLIGTNISFEQILMSRTEFRGSVIFKKDNAGAALFFNKENSKNSGEAEHGGHGQPQIEKVWPAGQNLGIFRDWPAIGPVISA